LTPTRVDDPALLINARGAIAAVGICSRSPTACSGTFGFHIPMHSFRHTFATVATQVGWNFERVRAAMGHSDYKVLQRYVRLATERNRGPRKEWEEFILPPGEV